MSWPALKLFRSGGGSFQSANWTPPAGYTDTSGHAEKTVTSGNNAYGTATAMIVSTVAEGKSIHFQAATSGADTGIVFLIEILIGTNVIIDDVMFLSQADSSMAFGPFLFNSIAAGSAINAKVKAVGSNAKVIRLTLQVGE